MSSPAGGSSSKGKKFVWLGIALVVILLASMYFWHAGYFHWPSPVEHAEARMDARAMNEFNTASRAAEKSADFEKAAGAYHEAKNELAHNRELIANGPQTCAHIQDLVVDEKGHWTEVTMDLTGCNEGQPISLHFGGNISFPTGWRIEVFTEDGTLAPRPPDVQVREDDGFNAVERVEDQPNVFGLKGERIYVFHKEGRRLKCTFLKAVS